MCYLLQILVVITSTNQDYYHIPAKHIDQTQENWKDIHKITQHGLALCYKVDKVNIIEVIPIPSVLEILPVVLEIEKETILLVIVYRMPGSLGTFIYDFYRTFLKFIFTIVTFLILIP